MSKSVELLKKIIELKPGGEVREQQEAAVAEIEAVMQNNEHLLLEAPTGSGKALRLDTPVLTNHGWKTMGTLTTDDQVYGRSGTLINIIETHEPFMSKRMFKITFSNGEHIYADADHLWHMDYNNAEAANDLKQLNHERIAELKTKTLQIGSDERTDDLATFTDLWTIPHEYIYNAFSNSTVTHEDENTVTVAANTFLEQYYVELLGREVTWRTEELFTQRNLEDSSSIRFGIRKADHIEFPASPRLPVPARFLGDWLVSGEPTFTEVQLNALLKRGIESNARIPEEYLFHTKTNREELLNGLTYGRTVNMFQTVTKELAEDFAFLVASLGYDHVSGSYIDTDDRTVYAVKLFDRKKKETVSDYIVQIEEVPGELVRCISVDSDDHLFLVGRTLIATHNTLSYLVPTVQEGKRVVISTATKQLSEDIIDVDIKFLNKALKEAGVNKKADAVLLKGRDNYLCRAKQDKLKKMDDSAQELFQFSSEEAEAKAVSEKGRQFAEQAAKINEWAQKTRNGDRSDGPENITDETWRQFSSTSAECPGKSACPFGEECFAEYARDKAKTAQIVVTNHAIVALDLAAEGQLLDERDIFIFDELHEADNYLSGAWGAELTIQRVENAHKLLKSIPAVNDSQVEELLTLKEEYHAALSSVETGLLRDPSRRLENWLIRLANVTGKMAADLSRKEKEATDSLKRIYSGARKTVTELNDIATKLTDTTVGNVRWINDTAADNSWSAKKKPAAKNLGRKEKASTLTMHCAPMQVGPKLQAYLADREATMIGMSATITVTGSMDIPLQNFALTNLPHRTLILDTPFDYKKQCMMYVPIDCPTPVGAERFEHEKYLLKDSTALIKAVGGRSLVLSTTKSGVEKYAAHYRKALKSLKFLAQGEGTNPHLVRQFKKEQNTSLIGTMGFWHGLDAPGKTLSLVIIDKFPFPSPADPLLTARKEYADAQGRNGFMEVHVTIADWMFRQGFGRAIRSRTDRAIVAAYEPRLFDKGYGHKILSSLFGVGLFRDPALVLESAKRLKDL